MAITVVHSAQTTGVATGALALVASAVEGDTLVSIFTQVGTTAEPSVKDNIGSAGWTVQATHCVFNTSGDATWVALKKAVGGETEITWTPGAGATVGGVDYWELAGASTTVDAIGHVDNAGQVATLTSGAFTTTDAGDIVLACATLHAGGSGTVGAWTGTGPLENIGTTTTRMVSGSYIPAKTLEAATFTANWTTSRQAGMLYLAVKPAAAGGATIPLQAASSTSAASAAVQAATTVPLSAAASSSAAVGALTAPPQVPLSPAASSSAASAALTAPTTVPLAPASSASAASAGVTAPTTIPLVPAASVSSAQGQVEVPGSAGTIPLQPAQGSSSASSLSPTAPTTVPLQPAHASSSAPVAAVHAGEEVPDELVMLL